MRLTRKVAGRLAAIAAALVVIVAVANPSHAGASPRDLTWAGEVNIVHEQNGYCLDSNFAKQVYMGPCNGGDYQIWIATVTPVGAGYDDSITLKDKATGYCLDSDGTTMYTHVCGSAYQNWIVATGGDLIVQYISDNCLDGSGTSVYIHDCNNGAYQNWTEYIVT